jgi:hypothetical protein
MPQNYTPFGYRYENGACIIKIRLHPNKFQQAGITHLGKHTVTKSGYIIFEATLDVKGETMQEFNRRMREPAAQ